MPKKEQPKMVWGGIFPETHTQKGLLTSLVNAFIKGTYFFEKETFCAIISQESNSLLCQRIKCLRCLSLNEWQTDPLVLFSYRFFLNYIWGAISAFLNHLKRKYRPWIVWLIGQNAGLRTKGSPVQFLVRVHAWVASVGVT